MPLLVVGFRYSGTLSNHGCCAAHYLHCDVRGIMVEPPCSTHIIKTFNRSIKIKKRPFLVTLHASLTLVVCSPGKLPPLITLLPVWIHTKWQFTPPPPPTHTHTHTLFIFIPLFIYFFFFFYLFACCSFFFFFGWVGGGGGGVGGGQLEIHNKSFSC